MTITKLLPIGTLLLGLGCNSVDSDGVFTSALYASIVATADGDGATRVETTLYLERPSSLNYIELEGGDVLMAYGPAAESKQMRESQFLGITSYAATFEAEDSGSEFIVELSRIVDDSAPDSRVTLPTAFDVVTADGTTYSRADDDIAIDWAPFDSGDDLDFNVSGSCIEPFGGAVEGDPGTLTILATELVKREAATTADSCEATVTLSRGRAGTVDPAYGHGGSAFAYQRRVFSFTTAP